MRRKLKVYLAGPEVFLPTAVEMGQRKKEICDRYGFVGLFPLDNEMPPKVTEQQQDLAIYRANVAMIRAANLGIVNLTPFRGPSADVGTVFELGLLTGLGKPVFGYTNETDDLLTRLRREDGVVFDRTAKIWRDAAGMAVEDFGNADNLMIDAALSDQDHPIVRHSADPRERFSDLTGFERCLKFAAETLLKRGVASRVAVATS